jgi:hypothetical protein
MFFVAAVISNALDDDLGVVATGEGAFRVRPIAFGLAFVVTRRRPVPLLVLAKVSRSFGGVFVNREIAERVDCVAFVARLDDEFLLEFSVGESGQTQHARGVGCREVAAEFVCETVEESLRFILTESAHFPDDLMLARRGIEDKVWCWDILRIPYCVESLITVFVEVEINVADISCISFGVRDLQVKLKPPDVRPSNLQTHR